MNFVCGGWRGTVRPPRPLLRCLQHLAVIVLVEDRLQFDIEAEAAHFLHEHVEALRNAGLEGVVALDDRFVDLGAPTTSSDFTVSISCKV